MISLSLVVTISRTLIVRVTATVTEIPALPDHTTPAVTAFLAAVAAAYLLVRKPNPGTKEATEIISEATLTDDRWVLWRQEMG